MKAPIEQGKDAAVQAMSELRDYVDCLPEPDRSQWWCGFITSAATWATLSVGFHNTETMLLAAREIIPTAGLPDNG